jgi:hypothetical protein
MQAQNWRPRRHQALESLDSESELLTSAVTFPGCRAHKVQLQIAGLQHPLQLRELLLVQQIIPAPMQAEPLRTRLKQVQGCNLLTGGGIIKRASQDPGLLPRLRMEASRGLTIMTGVGSET